MSISSTAGSALAILGALVALGITAAAGSGATVPATGSYYLALGDSIAYGIQPDKGGPGTAPSAFTTGYVDLFAATLRRKSPGLHVVNYSCPGESTVTFVRGGCPWLHEGGRLHDAFRGSQLEAALSFLRAHPGKVSPITLTLFGNDWIPILDRCQGRIACVRKGAPGAIAAFESRLGAILGRLRGAAPGAQIIVTGAWNPLPDQVASFEPLYRSLDQAIARAAARSRARVAKTLPVFNPSGGVQRRLCAFTFICSRGDPHPTDAGYRALAAAVAAASS